MLRSELNDCLKDAMRAKDERTVSTVRLILAALKDRDICARGNGRGEGVEEEEIRRMLSSMIKQRREAIEQYEQGGRLELAEKEREEIRVIERFLPRQLDESEIKSAVDQTIAEVGPTGVKDMGRVMQTLRQRYAGQMDFARASDIVKQQLM